jgi:hypothetical protein
MQLGWVKEPGLLNVAMTRGRSFLIIIANWEALLTVLLSDTRSRPYRNLNAQPKLKALLTYLWDNDLVYDYSAAKYHNDNLGVDEPHPKDDFKQYVSSLPKYKVSRGR